jgi:phage host-nuclease inhibitor protein Gam
MVDSNGGQASVGGWWPDGFDQKYKQTNSLVGRVKTSWAQTLGIAQRHHGQNTELHLAKVGNRAARVPDIEARQKLVNEDKKTLQRLEAQRNALTAEAKKKYSDLEKKITDFRELPYTSALIRTESRGYLHNLDPKKRLEAIRSRELRLAALEAPPELSGLSPEQHSMLLKSEVEATFPEEISELGDFQRAFEMLDTALQTTARAVENEAVASGAASKQAEPEAPAPWASAAE